MKITFEIDLQQLHKDHQGHCLIPRKFEHMIEALDDRYEGRDLQLMLGRDAKEMFRDCFSELFNY